MKSFHYRYVPHSLRNHQSTLVLRRTILQIYVPKSPVNIPQITEYRLDGKLAVLTEGLATPREVGDVTSDHEFLLVRPITLPTDRSYAIIAASLNKQYKTS
jgi:hypothetical protein